MLKNLIILWVIALYTPLVTAASDDAEKRWAGQLEKSIKIGKPHWLEAKGNKFLALYTPDMSGSPQGALILLHGLGMHPDWPEVIRPIRTRMPNYGWATLSLQMPVLNKDANLKDYVPLLDQVPDRLRAAIAFLQKQKIANIVIVGHDLGAAMGGAYLAEAGPRSKSGIYAFIGIAMEIREGIDPRMHITTSLEKVVIPVMDVYGNLDSSVVKSAPVRSRAARTAGMSAYKQQSVEGFKHSGTARTSPTESAGNIAYRQIMISGADHFFSGQEDILVKRIRGWLLRHASGKRVRLK